jgi:hypothetical protein
MLLAPNVRAQTDPVADETAVDPATVVQTFKTEGWDQLSESCKAKVFPISAGGSKDERVSCTIYDPKNQFIIVAGNSTSEDFVPAANDHAFAYAVDLDGNWKWGKFFYNVSFAVSTISGCQLDGNGNVVFLSMGDSMPVIMELNPLDGSITNFMSFQWYNTTESNVPWYQTFGGVYHDLDDMIDHRSYYYLSFVMIDYLQVLKVDKEAKTIAWNYQHYIDTNENDAIEYQNYKIPGLLHQDAQNPGQMFLIGRLEGYASVIKFSKSNFNIHWKVIIGNMKNSP